METSPSAPLPDPDSISSKGFTLNGALAFVDERWGQEGRARLQEHLPDELRRLSGGVVLSSSWYPFRHQVVLYETIDRVFGTGDLALCRDIGRFTAGFELGTVHRLFMKVARLDHWLKCASLMWRFYYSAGRLEPRMSGTSGDVSIREFHPISTAFCEDFAGWLEQTVVLTGASSCSVEHAECLLDGADRCLYRSTWTP